MLPISIIALFLEGFTLFWLISIVVVLHWIAAYHQANANCYALTKIDRIFPMFLQFIYLAVGCVRVPSTLNLSSATACYEWFFGGVTVCSWLGWLKRQLLCLALWRDLGAEFSPERAY